MSFLAFIKRFSPGVFLLILSCIEPYNPTVKQNVSDILVVEGFMNATTGTATVRLSHTMAISDPYEPVKELHASVSIKSSNGTTYILADQDSGKYTVKDLIIDEDTRYILHIETKSGIEYVSDSIRVKKTPDIDSLNFGISNNGQGMTILVTTHDPLNKARYYKWDYVETYAYHAAFYSGFHYKNGIIKFRKQEEQVYACWRSQPATSIAIGTSTGLSKDIINRHLVTTVHKTSPKISVRYSILVKQMAISKTEYDYLTQLKSTTEGLGGLFSTMPTAVTGNIHEVGNAQTPVLGYFSGAEIKEKRFFVDRAQLPSQIRVKTTGPDCELKQTCVQDAFQDGCVPREVVSPNVIVIYAEHEEYPLVPSFKFTDPGCGDCRVQGGTTKMPPFWKN